MTILHWAGRHWFLAWILISAAATIGWCVWLCFFGESDEQRDLRRRKEKAATAKANLRRNIEYHAAREKARRSCLSDAQINAAVEIVLADDDAQTRMREAEAYNSTEYERESDGKRVA